MCWAALDRATKLAPKLGEYATKGDGWAAERDRIRDAIFERGWSEKKQAFAQSFDSDDLDAAQLLMPLVGFLVAKIQPGSPAEKANLKAGTSVISFQGDASIPKGADAIVAVDGKPVRGSTDLGNLVSSRDAGTKVTLSVVNGKRHRNVTVTLAPRPASTTP